MTLPNARQGPEGPRSDQAATTRTDLEHQSTAPVVAVDPSGVVMLPPELPAELRELLDGLPESYPTTQAALTDTERLALALADTFGPTWARRLAGELLAAADDICPPRTPWPGGGRA